MGLVCVIECDSSILFLFILFLFMQDFLMVQNERFQEEEKQAHLVVSYKFLIYAPHDCLDWTCTCCSGSGKASPSSYLVT